MTAIDWPVKRRPAKRFNSVPRPANSAGERERPKIKGDKTAAMKFRPSYLTYRLCVWARVLLPSGSEVPFFARWIFHLRSHYHIGYYDQHQPREHRAQH